ncbi:MAG: hypothetical protein AAGF35_06055 [Pseudomonadota bacterium]
MSDFATTHANHIQAARDFTPQAITQLSWSRDQIAEAQTLGLRKVVAHAQQHSPYYANLIGSLEASTLDLSDLTKIPPLTKAIVMEHWDDIVTDRSLKLEDVLNHLDQLHRGEVDNPYFRGDLYAAATGGTSGKRGVYLWDWETFIVTANITYRMEMQRDLAQPPTGPRRTAVVCAGSYVHASRLLYPTSLDPKREIQVFPADTPLDSMVEALNRYQPDRLIGYASIVQELCALAQDGKLKIDLNRISTNSEPLFQEARDLAKEVWGIGINDAWGSVEIGLAATEGDDYGGVSLAEDFVIFEPVDDEDLPMQDPHFAERVLCTKLYGTEMPMIRYEMTDKMTFDIDANPDAPGCRRIKEIRGRADDWFVYAGSVKVHPMSFRGVLGQERHISEYQVIQTERGADVRVITHGDISFEALHLAVERLLKDAGVSQPEVTFKRVEELPRHPQTNKLKRFVPLGG